MNNKNKASSKATEPTTVRFKELQILKAFLPMKQSVVSFLLCIFCAPVFYAPLSAQGANTNKTIVRNEIIFPLQAQHVHGSSIVELPNGDFLACWFQGSGERTANDVLVRGARLKKGATKWSEPFLMADTPGLPDCNSVLFLNKEGKLFLFWIAVMADSWEQSLLRFRTSTRYNGDGPPIWDWQDDILFKPTDAFAEEFEKKLNEVVMPQRVNADGESAGRMEEYKKRMIEKSRSLSARSIGWQSRIHPITLSSGRILLPLYTDGYVCGLMGISDDGGTTWRPSLPIVGLGIQPALAVKKNGDIVAYMRAPGYARKSVSHDNGESWSVATMMEDKPSTASVELDVLQDGRWVYVSNDTMGGRYRLSLFVSHDEGETWKLGEIVEHDTSKEGNFSYPCLIQAKDGMIHLTYSYGRNDLRKTDPNCRSIKHVCIDPAKLP